MRRMTTTGCPSAILGPNSDDDYLAGLGERVWTARKALKMSRRGLAFDSGVSVRYLAQLETGGGNASVMVLRQIAGANGFRVEDLIAAIRSSTSVERMQLTDALNTLRAASGDPRALRVALIGLRGSGKSTLGRAVGEKMSVPFVELNREIEAESGLSIPGVFSFYGEGVSPAGETLHRGGDRRPRQRGAGGRRRHCRRGREL
jgi:XRE family aerobic/anaerobic benzoate catabolism transcriptional regulator